MNLVLKKNLNTYRSTGPKARVFELLGKLPINILGSS